MKWHLFFIISALFVYHVSSRALTNNDHSTKFYAEEKCLEELDLERDEIQPSVNEINTPEDNKEVGTFLLCVWKERGIIDEDGTVDTERFEEFFMQIFDLFMETSGKKDDISEDDEEKLKDVVERCKDLEGETEEQKAIILKNCMTQNMFALNLSS